jgi:sulfite reductase (NADPH) flavoprotein alpha-component
MDFALSVREDTGGAYDPAAGSLVNLWGFGPTGRYDQAGFYAPAPEVVAAVLAQRQGHRPRLDRDAPQPVPAGRRHPRFVVGGERLCGRLPGAAPGSAGRAALPGRSRRRAARRRRQADGQPWWVELEGVPDAAGAPVLQSVVALHGLAVATSGDYRRYFHHAHRRASHTLDPRTGYPIANDVASVTVLAPTCMAADALSTALTVMGVDAGLPFAEQRGAGGALPGAHRCRPARGPYRRLARPSSMMMTTEPLRWGGALLLSASYLAMCAGYLRAARARANAVTAEGAGAAAADWLVVYASQTGSAEHLARRSAELLATGGLAARAACISSLDGASLRGASRVLFIASTYGEGDAPDTAARFAGRLMADGLDLAHLHYAVLALGDRSYANFCGFGRALDAWLAKAGATPLFERIDVDRGNAAALEDWQHHLGRLAGTDDAPDWEAPAYADWRIAERELLNPGSAGRPAVPPGAGARGGACRHGKPATWPRSARPPTPDIRANTRSPRSLPMAGWNCWCACNGARTAARARRPAGCAKARLRDDAVRLRIREHGRFRLGENARRPMILLIGNGSGLAGLRGLLRARIGLGVRENWLLFGERNARMTSCCAASWKAGATGWLERLDLAFSRDQAERLYVQDVLRSQASTVREWVARGAAIYVCGSLQGMAGGVHEALGEILGGEVLEGLGAEGRYRRDVY